MNCSLYFTEMFWEEEKTFEPQWFTPKYLPDVDAIYKNCIGILSDLVLPSESTFELIICLASIDGFLEREAAKELHKGIAIPYNSGFDHKIDIRPITDNVGQEIANYDPKPMLTIGIDDLMSGPGSLPSRRILDPRYRFWDSSIWHRYVHINPPDSFVNRLQEVLTGLVHYNRLGLYESDSAKEFLEFQCRQFKNSYFINIPSKHSKEVIPVRFHSESEMKRKADHEFDKLKKLSFGVVIIDDNFKRPLNGIKSYEDSEEPVQATENSKIGIIKSLINTKDFKLVKFLNEEEKEPENSYISKGKEWIKKYFTLDLVFLDYYFQNETYVSESEKYGYYLIQALENEEEMGKHNLYQKSWVLPTSWLNDAFENQLKLIGQSNIGSNVIIGKGADPVTTPELFRYLFFRFLRGYISERGIDINSTPFERKFEKNGEIRVSEKKFKEAMGELYPEIVQLRANLGKLISAQKEGNLFAESYLKTLSKKSDPIIFFDKLQSLWYKLAFGGRLEWKKVWEEYSFIFQHFRPTPSKEESLSSTELLPNLSKTIRALLDPIDAYISKLTNSSQNPQ